MSSNNFNFDGMVCELFPLKERHHYIAKSKKDGTIFSDYLNKSGCLTKYIEENFGIDIPSSYKRLRYLKENRLLWHQQYFDIELIEDAINIVKKCPYCEWSTIDVNNLSGMFITHLRKAHNISKSKYITDNPTEKEYFLTKNNTENLQLETDDDKYVVCKICGKKLKRIDWKHLNKHNISKEEYSLTYGNTVSNDLHDKLSKITRQTNMQTVPSYESKAEAGIKEIITKNGLKCVKSRSLLKGKEIDIYIPSRSIAIEYDGLIWHTEWFGKKDRYYHINKSNECKEKGVSLIHIFEDEYVTKKEIVENKLKHILKLDNVKKKIYARKCEIREISKIESYDFLDSNHIQGHVSATIYLGCFYNSKLVGVMQFKKEGDGRYDLNRFATDINYNCIGVGGKLFKHFVRKYNPTEVKSFADRRWTVNETDNLYTKLGFKFDKYTAPDYTYYNSSVNKYKRFHKFGFRKNILSRKYGFPLTMTEKEMAKKLGYDRIWNCGLIRYVWQSVN